MLLVGFSFGVKGQCPTITKQPVSQSDCDGNLVTFNATINGGTAPYTYAWQRQLPSESSFSNISVSNTNSIDASLPISDIGSIDAPDNTQYRLIINDANLCSITTNVVILSVNKITGITPGNTTSTLCLGNSLTYAVATQGTVQAYQWRKDGADMPGAISATLVITNAQPSDVGSYSVRVTFEKIDDSGTPKTCQRTSSLKRLILLEPTLSGPASICLNSSGNVYTTEVAKTNYQWTINGGNITSGGNPITSTATVTWDTQGARTISVNYTDPNTGCTPPTATVYDVTVNSLPVLTVTPTQIACFGGTGSVALSGTNGTPPYTYGGDATSGLTPGTYNYTVTDANGCSAASLPVTITQPAAALATSETHVNVLCFGNATGSINLTVTGGTTNYTYLWTASTGGFVPAGQANNQDLTGLVAGTYDVVVTDANLCTTNQRITITQPAAALSVTSSSNSPICQGLTLNLSSATGGTGTYSYSWSGPNGFSSTLQNPSIINATTVATVTYTVKITDSNGCSATSLPTIVTVNPLPTVTITSPSVCIGNPATVTATPTPTGSYFYAWTVPGGASAPGNVASFTTTIAGTYSVIVTNTTTNCISTSENVIVSFYSPPIITLDTPLDTSVCKDNNITLIASALGSPTPTVQWQVSTDNGFSWSNLFGQTNPSLTLVNVHPNFNKNQYKAIFYNLCGTAFTNATILHVGSTINIGITPPANAYGCNGIGDVSFTANGNGGNGTVYMSWQYSSNGGSSWFDISGTTTTSFQGNFSTTYTFTPVLSQNGYLFRAKFSNDGCVQSFSNSALLTILISPTVTIGPVDNQLVCNGALTNTVIFTGTNATSFSWTNDNTSIGLAANGTGNIASFAAVNTGNTPVTATITVTPINSNGGTNCPGISKSFTIIVNPSATANAGPAQSLCAGGTVTLAGTIGGSATSCTWSAPSGSFSNPNSLTSTYTPTITNGTVALTLTTDNPSGPCPAVTSTVVITVNPIATANAGTPQNVCSGGSITLAGTIGGSSTSAVWYAPSGILSNPNSLSSTYTPSISSGTVILTLTTDDPAGPCPVATSTVVITVNPVATANAGVAQSVCAGGTVTLAGTIGGSATSGTWWAPSGTFSNSNSLTSTYTPSISNGTVTLTLTTDDPSGPCPAVTSTVIITVNAIPLAPTGTGNSRCGTGTVSLTASGCAGGVLKWYDAVAGGTQVGTGSPFVTPSISVTTLYWASCTNASSCEGPRTQVIATVNAIPSAPTGINGSRCGTGTVSLAASGCSGTLNWYTAASGGASIGTGSTFNTSSISITTTYYVSCTSAAGCESSRTPVEAVVKTIPVEPVAVDGTSCGSGTVLLDATGCTGTLNWYATSSGGSPMGTGNLWTTPHLIVTTNYWVSCTLNGCESPRTKVVATIRPVDPGSIAADQTICSGGDPEPFTGIDASSADKKVDITYKWQSAPTGTGPWTDISGATSNVYNVPSGLSTSTFYRRVATGKKTQGQPSGQFTCDAFSNVLSVTVNPLPTITPAAGAASVCFSTVAQTTTLVYSAISNSPTTYSITWNALPANSFIVVTNAALPVSPIIISVPANTTAGTYTGTINVRNANNCVSSTGIPFTVTVNPLPTTSAIYHR